MNPKYDLPPSPWPQRGYPPIGARSRMDSGGAPRFAVALWIVEEAFWHVLEGVAVPKGKKDEFYPLFVQAFWSGNPREVENVASRCFGPSDFDWPEYDCWDAEFQRAGRAPDWWPSLRAPKATETLEDVMAIARMADLRAMARQAGLSTGMLPKTKVELCALLTPILTFDLARPCVEGLIVERAEKWRRDYQAAKLGLLTQTLASASHNLSRWYAGQEIILDGLASGWGWRWTSLAPVEDTWARRLYDPETGIIPPFFPGDRTRHSYTRV